MKKYSLYLGILVLLFACALQSCKKDKGSDPEIQTTSVTSLSLSSVLMKGNIINKGSFKVLDYGFVYSTTTSGINETIGTKVSLGTSAPEGEYSKQVDGITTTGSYSPVLYVRAYLTNERGTAFGKLTTITLPTPSTSNVSPLSGRSGDQVTITGQFYTTAASDVKVTFNGTQATVLSVSQTQVVVQVPSGISAAHNTQIPIAVSVAGRSITASYSFVIQANVKDYSPKSGPVGTIITFSGDNLPSYYYGSDISVLFGGISQSIGYYSSGMQATVPSTVTSSSVQVSAVVGGKTFALPGSFSVTAPTITSLSPGSGLPGSTVTVYGSNFPTTYGSLTGTLGGVSVGINTYSSGQLTFTVPSSMSAGSYAFILKAGPNNVSAPQNFTVSSPSISSFSPSSGAIGKQVTIYGTFVSGQYYTVYFGSSSVSAYASSSSAITVNVPSGLSGGDYKISVTVGGQTITAPGTFTVTTPSITSFSPTSGVPGTIVTINGTGFNSTYYNTVTFGSINATVLSSSDNVIKAIVPSNTGNGAMKITVNTSGQTIVSSDNFTVTN